MVYMDDVLKKDSGPVMVRGCEAEQGEHFRLFGGHEEGIGDLGHLTRAVARVNAH